jgi:2-oxoglutarate dehydrogenase E2 component (dihydrolipoamide succinyltransferase)
MKEVVVPSVGESITEVTFSKQIIKEGEYAEKDAPIFELESDKASVEVTAPLAGIIRYSAKVGDLLKIGAKVCSLEEGAAPLPVAQAAPFVAAVVFQEGGIKKSPDQFLQSLKEEPKSIEIEKKEEKIEISDQRREPLSKLRKVIAKRLVQVKNETAMLSTFNEVDLFEIMAIRNREKDRFLKEHGVKLTYLPFFIKAALVALKEFPVINAFIDGDDIVYNTNSHIGIAVSTETGLVVPVIKNANEMTFLEIAKALQDLGAKARDRKLSINDMSGGTFTITNGGVFGSMLSTPILNPPQSAILGMHNIVDRPVAKNGQVVIRPIMYLALSYDHRIIDGKESVSFLVRIKELLEDPSKFLLST